MTKKVCRKWWEVQRTAPIVRKSKKPRYLGAIALWEWEHVLKIVLSNLKYLLPLIVVCCCLCVIHLLKHPLRFFAASNQSLFAHDLYVITFKQIFLLKGKHGFFKAAFSTLQRLWQNFTVAYRGEILLGIFFTVTDLAD